MRSGLEENHHFRICAPGDVGRKSMFRFQKKRKLGPKTVDCIFLGYAPQSVGYRFLVVKSEVPDMH